MMKKYACKVLAAAMAVSMMVPGVSALAATNTNSGNNTDPKASTNVTYKVDEAYTWSVPTEINFTSNATVTTAGTTGNEQDVYVSKNVIPETKKLHISLATNNTFTIISEEGKGKTLNYTVKVVTNNVDGDVLKAGDTVLDVNAGTDTASTVLKFELTKDDVERAGEYKGTVSYESSVVDK